MKNNRVMTGFSYVQFELDRRDLSLGSAENADSNLLMVHKRINLM